VICNRTATAITAPSGWTRLGTLPNGSVIHAQVFAKVADSSEAGTTIDFVADGPVKAVAQVYRISGWYGGALTGTDNDGCSVGAGSGTSVSPNPPNRDPANWGTEDALWLAFAACDGHEAVSAYPLGFTDGWYSESDAAADSVSLASAVKSETVSNLDPGTFTIANSQEWVGVTVVVRPSSAGGEGSSITSPARSHAQAILPG
jgi:hypothetical protein